MSKDVTETSEIELAQSMHETMQSPKPARTVNILGTEYCLSESTDREDSGLVGNSGYCDYSDKRIVIDADFSKSKHPLAFADLESRKKSTIRHEIIHGFFAEAALSDYCHNEQLVDWIADMAPKLFKAFQEVDAL